MNIYIFLIFIAIAFYTDVRYYRIPNKLNLLAVASGLIYSAYSGGWQGLANSVGGMLALFAASFILYLIRAVGAGDVKLFAAIGALIGVEYSFLIFIYSLIYAGVIAIILSLIQKKLAVRIYFGFSMLIGLLFRRGLNSISSSPRFPMMWAVLPAVLTVVYRLYFNT